MDASEAIAATWVPGRLCECRDCGLIQSLPALPRDAIAECPRCGATLRRRRRDPYGRPLALGLTGLLLFGIAASMPFMAIDIKGRVLNTTLSSGPEQMDLAGLWEIAGVVLFTTILAPGLKLLMMIYVLLALRVRRPPRHVATVFRWVERLRPWSMVEVFLLGVCVAYTKLIDLAHVDIGPAVWALGALMLVTAWADSALDGEAVWAALESKGATAEPMTARTVRGESGEPLGCKCCGMVSRGRLSCPRCGATLHHRKPDSITRAWALLAAAAVMYIPANILPVMTVISFGQGAPSTILGGVQELIAAQMWPLALLVFFASITVPVLKVIGMLYLLISTRRRAAGRLRQRTVIYRIIEAIGRWSMIDVFMISILTALVRMGEIATIRPGNGAIAFCSVVILTMFAAMSFDPRLMWDAAGQPGDRR